MLLRPRAGRDGRWGAVSSRSATRLRKAAAAQGALPAVAALLALAVSTPAASGGAHGARAAAVGQPPASGTPPGPQAAPAARYRIVGCRNHGFAAYLHGPHVRRVAIGFDDGPASDTGAFVSMLERARARATFFLIGDQIGPGYRQLMLRELRDGDVLGDHSFSHPNLTAAGNVAGQLQRTRARIRELTGYTPCVFRPPYGAYDGAVVRTAHSLGLATVLWNVDPRDWALPGSAAIRRVILSEVQPGSIIISHDGVGLRRQTLAAYPGVIAALRARGYRIVTIPELLGFKPVYRPCLKLCDGIGVPRSALPPGAIIERAA
jgi:peptidoglycan-N-acetylglucosamine deacetylase